MASAQNMRIYKKRAKRAREILTCEFGYRSNSFDTLKSDDEAGYELLGNIDGPEPLCGTPVVVEKDYWTEDCNIACCVEYVLDHLFWDVSHAQLNRRYSQLRG
jgi:hypothetical protein